MGETAAPMRALTRAIAMGPCAWTPERANQIAALFDSSASAWRERDSPERYDALADALARGGSFPGDHLARPVTRNACAKFVEGSSDSS